MKGVNEDYYAIDSLDISAQRLGCVEDSLLYINMIGKSVNRKKAADLYMRTRRLRRDLLSLLEEMQDAQEDYEESCPCSGQRCCGICEESDV